ncbi:MAG: hypothetical protein ACOCXA_05980 [Planctomycetota bacterium]
MSENDNKPADEQQPDTTTDADLPEVDEWKPEPRTWGWKDLFTAPMLAFKPKCMVVSVLTLIAVYLVSLLHGAVGEQVAGILVLDTVVTWVFYALMAVIFGLGTVFVTVFYRADLLDDEFLSLKEGCGQYKSRFVAAAMVPLFLIGVAAGMLLLVYLGQLLCSIPYLGSVLYLLFYSVGLSYLLALFALLLIVGVMLSFFVFPAIVAVRKHGWFDNVIDTFEAVGTKPHVLVSSIVVTLIMALVAYGFGIGAMTLLKKGATADALPGSEVALVEARANEIVNQATPVAYGGGTLGVFCPYFDPTGIIRDPRLPTSDEASGWYVWFTGLLTGIVQSVLIYLILGYCLNIILAGGMLTYLNVREDDYWDDEDLEDLDKLAKELEEEAKAAAEEAEREAAAASAAEAKPADTDKSDASTMETIEDSGEKPAVDAEGDAKPEQASEDEAKQDNDDEKQASEDEKKTDDDEKKKQDNDEAKQDNEDEKKTDDDEKKD